MLASVTRLTPRRGSFEEALAAFRAASLQLCLSHLHGNDSIAAKALHARTLLRLGNPQAAGSILALSEGGSDRERAEVALLRAAAHSRVGNAALGADALRDALVYAISANDRALETEAHFYAGLIAFGSGDLARARESCEIGLDVAMQPRTPDGVEGVVPLAHVIARTQELLGVVDSAQGRYGDFLKNAGAALDTFDRSGVPDAYLEAFGLRNLATLARDFDLDEQARTLGRRVSNLRWTPDIAHVEFTTVEALAWCSALGGESVDALRFLRRAGAVATTDSERIIVSVDRALFARESGHRAMLVEEIDYALGLARHFDWETAPGDTRDALLVLAQAAAAIEPARARQALDRYASIRNAMDATFAARVEPRARAEEAYTHGLVLRAEGRPAASAERLTTAFEIWDRIGFAWRSGRAALELAELDAGDIFRQAVRRELIRRPNSVFSARARLVA